MRRMGTSSPWPPAGSGLLSQFSGDTTRLPGHDELSRIRRVSDTEERPATGAEAPAREQPRAEERAADQAVAEGSPGDLTMADRASEGNGGRRHARRRVVLGRRHARRRVVLGWAAATVGIAGLAWLLNSLITSWTSYATLTVTKWQMLTYGPRSAQLRFSVHNSGT